MKKFLQFILLIPVCATTVRAQVDSTAQKLYKVHLAYELPGAVACIGLSTLGFRNLERLSSMTAADVNKLNINNINSFDRSSATLDPSKFADARTRSQTLLNISLFTPAIFALDKKIRKDWLDLLTLYLVTHAVDNAVYFAGTYPFRRARPLTYNPRVPMEEKTGNGKSNSFFSGHTSFAATATFFAARIYTDYHHITGWKRVLFYAAAAVPPALVGYYRVESGSHFKTDVITGFLVGASSGIFVPALHKFKKKHDNLSFAPFYTPGSSGLTMTVGL